MDPAQSRDEALRVQPLLTLPVSLLESWGCFAALPVFSRSRLAFRAVRHVVWRGSRHPSPPLRDFKRRSWRRALNDMASLLQSTVYGEASLGTGLEKGE